MKTRTYILLFGMASLVAAAALALPACGAALNVEPNLIPVIDPHLIPVIDPHLIPVIDPHLIPVIDPHLIPVIDPHMIMGWE